jgi:hypothetical protein
MASWVGTITEYSAVYSQGAGTGSRVGADGEPLQISPKSLPVGAAQAQSPKEAVTAGCSAAGKSVFAQPGWFSMPQAGSPAMELSDYPMSLFQDFRDPFSDPALKTPDDDSEGSIPFAGGGSAGRGSPCAAGFLGSRISLPPEKNGGSKWGGYEAASQSQRLYLGAGHGAPLQRECSFVGTPPDRDYAGIFRVASGDLLSRQADSPTDSSAGSDSSEMDEAEIFDDLRPLVPGGLPAVPGRLEALSYVMNLHDDGDDLATAKQKPAWFSARPTLPVVSLGGSSAGAGSASRPPRGSLPYGPAYS